VHGLSFDLQCYPGQMAGLVPLIERHPDAGHHQPYGNAVLTDADGLAEWRRAAGAGRLPHVAIKLSGLGFIRRDWDQALVLPLLAEVVDLFGTQRAMFASDTPTDKLFARCRAIWTPIAVSRRGSASRAARPVGAQCQPHLPAGADPLKHNKSGDCDAQSADRRVLPLAGRALLRQLLCALSRDQAVELGDFLADGGIFSWW
jgi:hypothetical protein